MKKILLLVAIFAISFAANAQLVSEDFESDTVMPATWTTYSPTYDAGSGNTFKWHYSVHEGNGYMRGSSYSGGNFETEQWLITPVFSTQGLNDIQLAFKNEKAQYAGNALQVFVSTDYDGDSLNFANATWTEVTDITLSTGTYEWVESISDISSVANNDTVYVGFKYTSTDTEGAVWDVDSVQITGSTDINTVAQSLVSVYPNPTSDYIFFNVNSVNNDVTIINNVGQIIMQQNNVRNSVNVSDLQAGAYMVIIENENGRTVKKFLKK